MADFTTNKLEGWEQFERNLNKLNESLAKKGSMEAARAGAAVALRAIRERAMSMFKAHTGRLFRGFAVSSKIYWHGVAGAAVWFKIGLKTRPGKDAAWYGRLLETDHYAVGSRKRSALGRLRRGLAFVDRSGKLRKGRRGRGEGRDRARGNLIKGRPFMGPAFEANLQQALQAMANKLRSFIETHRGA